ncbi:MAG: dTMP kinase [Sphaerochaetaceae bacterium]
MKNFIVFEGLDGAGTTTQLHLLSKQYKDKGIECFETFEPTDNPIGRLVRSILRKEVTVTAWSLALLYSADREEHLHDKQEGIIQQLEQKKLVVCDRYFYSSLAYQGVDCDFANVMSINEYPHPEFVFYIDTPVEECIARIEKRGKEKELFEKTDFLTKVKANYEKAFSLLPRETNLIRLDGKVSIAKINEEVRKVLFP